MERHARCAHVEDRRDEVDRTHDRARTRKVERDAIAKAVKALDDGPVLSAGPIINGKDSTGGKHKVRCPHDLSKVVGTVKWADTKDVDKAFAAAVKAQPEWNNRGGVKRADILRDMAHALEDNMERLIAIMAREGGKTLSREAVTSIVVSLRPGAGAADG